jgi:hypothetical protein
VNLKQALGIVDWQSLDATFVDPSIVFCVGEELVDCWESDTDPRWVLLSSIVQALGRDLSSLEPAEPEDVPPSAALVLCFDGQQLPLLSEMLENPSLKAQAWETLCAVNT